MPNVIIKDNNGVNETYNNVTNITLNTDNGVANFVYPIGTKGIIDTTLTDVTSFANAQISDNNLIPENIAKNVNILGITGTFVGGDLEEKELTIDNIDEFESESSKYVLTLSPAEGKDGFSKVIINIPKTELANRKIIYGESIFGLNGYRLPKKISLDIFVEYNTTSIYINSSYNLSEYLSSFQEDKNILIIGAGDEHNSAIYYFKARNNSLELWEDDERNVLTLYSNNKWNVTSFDFNDFIQSNVMVIFGIDDSFVPIIDEVFCLKQISFGTVTPPPPPTEENVIVEGNNLIFDGDTTVTNNELIIASDGYVEDNTLIFGTTQSENPTINGNELIFDGNTGIDGNELVLASEADINNDELNFN